MFVGYTCSAKFLLPPGGENDSTWYFLSRIKSLVLTLTSAAILSIANPSTES